MRLKAYPAGFTEEGASLAHLGCKQNRKIAQKLCSTQVWSDVCQTDRYNSFINQNKPQFKYSAYHICTCFYYC